MKESNVSGSTRRLLDRVQRRWASKPRRPGVPQFTRITRRQLLIAKREGGAI
jgi:hypothetical protein